jgi:hypothetical protein
MIYYKLEFQYLKKVLIFNTLKNHSTKQLFNDRKEFWNEELIVSKKIFPIIVSWIKTCFVYLIDVEMDWTSVSHLSRAQFIKT